MAVSVSNGTPKSPSAKESAMNGTPNGSAHHHRGGRSKSKRKTKQTTLAWTADKALKVTVWYTIITLAFRCPTAQKDLTVDTPKICKPSLQARDFVLPYTRPYYDQYLSPYVAQAQPYIDQFNSKVYEPGYAAYQKYGAPRVADAQKYSQQQWEKSIKPQLEVLQKESGKQYETHLSPHVKKAQDVVQPYYDSVKTSAGDIWELELEPVYRRTKPIADKFYSQGQEFALKTALPQAQFVSSSVWSFWSRQLWPRVRILYGENVEPQLLRITERLGRYKDGKKLEADIKSLESSSKLSQASVSASEFASTVSASAQKVTETLSGAASAASQAASRSPESIPDPKEQFHADLKSWEHICERAVEEGSEDLRERIQDITDAQIKSADNLGGALVTQLEQTTESALNSVKARIQQVVRNLPHDAEDSHIESANTELVAAIRAAGQTIKQRAQAVREWRQSKDVETNDLIEKAVQSTLETIEHIRDLRLTEIGRKYASTSLPHKEWSKYNDLKKATHSWRRDVKKSAHDHPGVGKARSTNEDVEHQAMAIAEDAAKELGRLKEVGKWKIAADEDSDDFSTRYVPPPVRKAKEAIVEKIAEASQAVLADEVEQGTVESATSIVVEKASEAASQLSEAAIGSSGAAGSSSSIAKAASKSASSASEVVAAAASSVSEKVIGSSTGAVESAASKISEQVVGSETPLVKSLSDKASKSAGSAASVASEAIIGRESSLADSAKEAASSVSSAVLGESSLSDSVTDAASAVSSIILGSEEPVTKSVKSKLSSALSAQKENQSAASKSVSSAANEVKKSASSASSAISEAILDGEDVTDTVKKAASSATAKPKKVMGGAMAQVLVEAREPILDDIVDGAESFSESLESIVNAAGDKASELTKAVEDALKRATVTQGTVESVTSIASEQYQSAIAAASSILFGTPKGAVEQGSSAARAQYEAAVTAASHAIYGTPITAAPFAHASSVYDNAVSEAVKHYEQVKSRLSEQISGTPEPIHQQMFSSAESAYSAAVEAASERLHAITRTQNPYESISSAAASRLADAVAAASSQYKSAKIAVGAEPTPLHQQYLAFAQKRYYEALGVAHGRYSEFLEAASSVLTPAPTATGISAQFDSALSGARSSYDVYVSAARSQYSSLVKAASTAASERGLYSIGADTLQNIEKQLADASSIASSKYAAASSDVSVAVWGTTPPYVESVVSRAAENWEALIAGASEQVYGAPPPFTESIASQVTEFASQATEAAAAQWEAVSGLFAELISGKEPDFTESIYSRLQSAYSTGAPALVSQASVVASVAYESAASAVSAIFVPPTQVPGILEQMQDQLNAAVDAASAQVYGTQKGTVEQMTEAAASAYSEAASQVSQAVYGKDANYVEKAQSNIADIGASASSAIHAAVYGSPTNTIAAASSAAASVYSSIASQAAQQASAASAAVSSAIFGEEQTYLEGVQSQLSVAVASANSRISELSVQASKAAGDAAGYISSAAEEVASSVSSVVSEATDRVRDEL